MAPSGAPLTLSLLPPIPLPSATHPCLPQYPLQCNALMLVLYTRALRYNSSLACTAATT